MATLLCCISFKMDSEGFVEANEAHVYEFVVCRVCGGAGVLYFLFSRLIRVVG